MCNDVEMPKYQSHKVVHALKIRVFYQNETDGTPDDPHWVTKSGVKPLPSGMGI